MKSKLHVDLHGNKLWYLNDKIHREDGPAMEYANGAKFWLINGKYHREDGPALEYPDGTGRWYFNDVYVHCSSQQEFERYLKLKAFW